MPRPKKVLPNNAGLIDQRRNHKTKTLIGLYEAYEAGIDSDPNRPYITVCEDHGNLVSHETKQMALQWMAHPVWCEPCQKRIVELELASMIDSY